MCKTDADCIKPAICKGGVCQDVAEAEVDETADTEPQVRIEPELADSRAERMRSAIALLLPLLSACGPTAADYLMARTWSARARAAVVADRSQCEPAQACSAAVQILASEGAGKAHVTTTSAACILPARARGASVMDLGGLLAAADVIAKIAADRMLEREEARLAALHQAGEDLDAERRICR